jgi:hypothetical protein
MKYCIVSQVAVVVLASVSLCVAAGPMDCVSEITMPDVAGIMMEIPTTIQVRVTIGKDGRAAKVDYGSARPIIRFELDRSFKRENRYLSVCENRTITFIVRYLVEGDPTPFPVFKVKFRPPDEFVVVAHPIEPSLDPFPQVPPRRPEHK